MDASFADQEKRFLLAEMIKASPIDVDAVVGFIKSYGISPNWLEMQIPRGRTVNQCCQAAAAMGIESPPHTLSQHHQPYRQLGQQTAQQAVQMPQQHQRVQQSPSTPIISKRKQSSDSAEPLPKRLAVAPPADTPPVSLPRTIQPRPSANGLAFTNPPATPDTPASARNTPKKRGRPSRAAKDAQARASGSLGYHLPHLAPAPKQHVATESAPPLSRESSARMTPEGRILSTEARESTPLKPKASPAKSNVQDEAPGNVAMPKPSPDSKP